MHGLSFCAALALVSTLLLLPAHTHSEDLKVTDSNEIVSGGVLISYVGQI
jgi:hypothetical protein